MHHRCDKKIDALGCKHQRSKARKKVGKAADGQYAAPIEYLR